MFNIPVLLIIFNRPETTKKVFQRIELIKPKKLYIVADGPRSEKEIDLIKQSREIVEKVNWDCEIHKKYSSNNLGCGINVSEGITWFFEKEEMGIILEDDVIPSLSFFEFAEKLLHKYKDDTRIMHISAVRYNEERSRDNYSYFFSRYAHIYGWATWKRAWNEFDINIIDWPRINDSKTIENIFPDPSERKYWIERFNRAYNLEKKHFWGYQWQYAVNKNNGYCITPQVNLAQNIGITGEHNSGLDTHHFRPIIDDFIITKDPEFLIINKWYDDYHFKKHIHPKKNLLYRIIRKIYREINCFMKN